MTTNSNMAAASDEEQYSEFEESAVFHGFVRQSTVCLVIFMALYLTSYGFIRSFKKRHDCEDDLYAGDDEDQLVYRISFVCITLLTIGVTNRMWICTFSLAVSVGAALLLPFTILANEVLLLYPYSSYIKWLNISLIQNLWNYVFLMSNLCLFILIPFSYFFIESQGFTGLKKGIMTRVYESLAVCLLSIVLIFCMIHFVSILFDENKARSLALFKIWHHHLPFIYSCVSLFGVFLLLVCTPLGFARMFNVVSNFIVKPKLMDVEVQLMLATLEEETLLRKKKRKRRSVTGENGISGVNCFATRGAYLEKGPAVKATDEQPSNKDRYRLGVVKSLRWFDHCKFPVAIVALLILTGLAVLMVVNNVLQILVGFRTLPHYSVEEYVDFGIGTSSSLGFVGAIVEVTILFYLTAASLVGFYSLPILGRLKPTWNQTSMTKLIGNCTALLVLSSAMPVLARTLGITTFDLLGAYGKIDWLGNFYLICAYNIIFAAVTTACLATKFTATVRREFYARIYVGWSSKDAPSRHASGCLENHHIAELPAAPIHQKCD